MKTKTFIHVEACQYLRDYVLRLRFTDGVMRDVDLAGELSGAVFEPLRDPALFRQVRVSGDTGTIEWPNGADFAPEFLYGKGL